MTEQTVFSAEDVATFYDELEKFFSSWLGESIHYGYWPPEDTGNGSFTEAQDRLTGLLGERLALRPEQRLLDVGCGTGRPAVLIGSASGAEVTGITISQRQLDTALERVSGSGPANVRFQLADAMTMPFADGEFDAAMALESLLHMPDKRQVLRQVHRVLRPGGRFVVADFFETRPVDPDEAQAGPAGAVPFSPPPPLADLVELLTEAGFAVTEVLDITEATQPTYAELLGAVDAQSSTLDSIRGSRIAEQIQHAIPAMVAHARQHTGYVVLTADKVVSP